MRIDDNKIVENNFVKNIIDFNYLNYKNFNKKIIIII